MDTQDPMTLPLNNSALTSLMTTKGTGTISGMSLKKSKHKKTKSISGPEIFEIPKEDLSEPVHRRSRSTRAPTNSSIGSINQVKQNLYSSAKVSSSSTLKQSSTCTSVADSLYNSDSKSEDNGLIDLNVLNNDNINPVEKSTTNSSENEWIIQALCEIENGFQVVLDRVKQNINSCKVNILFNWNTFIFILHSIKNINREALNISMYIFTLNI